jgi:murein DD-endopeptidase MepM/ murein hydrolase activator NlpD
VVVRVRADRAAVHVAPDGRSEQVGTLQAGQQRVALALVFRRYTWLRIPWSGDVRYAWIAAQNTDFTRSAAYSQVSADWYAAPAVLTFRRSLMQALLRARGADAGKLAQVERLTGEALVRLEDTLTRQTVPPGYVTFWQLRDRLGLPDPFAWLPVHAAPPGQIDDVGFHGFGPTTFAFRHWALYYAHTRGLHSGVDYIVPEGTPLIAVADGEIVPFDSMAEPRERTLALRPYRRAADRGRVLSNVIVGYAHLMGDPTSEIVRIGDTVRAGQIIGTSGWPVYTRSDGSLGVQRNNAHLHLETHFITDGERQLGSQYPINPLLFWSPRLIAWQARLGTDDAEPPYPSSGQPWGRLGYFSVGGFSTLPQQPRVWDYTPTREAIWPPGVYSLEGLVEWVSSFAV